MVATIKITYELDNKKFRLVPRQGGSVTPCLACAFYKAGIGANRKFCVLSPYWLEFNEVMVCRKLRGVWKEEA